VKGLVAGAATLVVGLPLGVAMAGAASGPGATGGGRPSAYALEDIPAELLQVYQEAAAQTCGMPWGVLAAVGSVESDHGRSTLPGVQAGSNSAGAMGPMQFLGPTWAAYGVDGDHDGDTDVYDPVDAIWGAANYLCANGAGEAERLRDAIWHYNHDDAYVEEVLARARRYSEGGLGAPSADVAQLVANPNLTLSDQARDDLENGLTDPRVVALLNAIVANHSITVSVIKSGHSKFVAGTDRVSNHYACDGCPGRAVDITSVDGAGVSSSNTAARALAESLLTASAPLRPDELGSPWPDLGRYAGAFHDQNHLGHLHVGYRANQ
jgi:hypothetical protein